MKKTFIIFLSLVLVSCYKVPSTTIYTDRNVNLEKNNVNVELIVNCSKIDIYGLYFHTVCNNFTLVVLNKNIQNIEINWNKSFYIENRQTNGGFLYGGITYLLRNAPKQNDIVFSNRNFSRVIYPINLTEFSSGNWQHNQFPLGEIGIYLTLVIDKKEVEYKLVNQLKKKEEIL
jgi:hypothetical protein